MEQGSRFGRQEQESAWQNAEVTALYRLADAGVRVPKPYNFIDGVLLMELVTDGDGQPAPRLNDLVGNDGPVIIDLPKAVDAAGNNNARMMLERDANNMAAYFGQFAPELLSTDYGREMWKLYQSGDLHPGTPLTGVFEDKSGPADVRGIMREIETARLENEAKLLYEKSMGIGS